MGIESFDDGGKLDVSRSNLLEEMVELQRLLDIDVVDHGHGVPLHPMAHQRADAAHDLTVRTALLHGMAIGIVNIFWTIYGHAHQDVVLLEETRPLVGDERTVGLKAVVYVAAIGIFSL